MTILRSKTDTMRKLTIIAVIISILMFSGCNAQQTKRLLNNIESYITERPDSALTVLDKMDRSLLSTDRLKAHHALLHAMALDKNYIDVKDDSLARVAFSYYSRKGPEKYAARSLYYLGLSYYYAGDFNNAILEFTKAENVAERSDSLYWGFVKVAQANTYSKTHNDIESLNCIKTAYQIYTDLKVNYYVNVAELELAKAYYNNHEYSKADSLYLKLTTAKGVDPKIYSVALQNRAFMMVSMPDPDYQKAISLYRNIINDPSDFVSMSHKDYWAYSYALASVGEDKEAKSIVYQLSHIDSSVTANYWLYRIKKLDGDYRQALTMLEKSVTANNIDVTTVLEQSLALTQREYYESQAEIYQYKEQHKTMVLICILAISFFIISSSLFILFRYIHIKNEEKERYIQYADDISRQLEASKNADYPALKKKYLELYHSKFETIGYLYEQYVLSTGKKNSDKILSDKIKSIISDFKDSFDETKTFENLINTDMDNIVQKLRDEVTDLKEIDYKIFSFTLVGFDVTTISHLLDMSINAVHIRRTRIRKHIEEKKPVHMTEFMEIMSSKGCL